MSYAKPPRRPRGRELSTCSRSGSCDAAQLGGPSRAQRTRVRDGGVGATPRNGWTPAPALGTTQVARTARGVPAELTPRRSRALLPMCRVTGPGRFASRVCRGRCGRKGQASSGPGRRDGVCGVQLERRCKPASRPTAERKPRTGRAIGQLQAERNNATSTSYERGNI